MGRVSLPATNAEKTTATAAGAAAVTVENRLLDGPHGELPVRIYRPAGPAPIGLVWLHGGGFWTGDLDMPEADWVARAMAPRGIVVVSVDYRLSPALESDRPARGDAHYPIASQEAAFAFEWAAASGLTSGAWAFGGASAGGNLATGAVLRLMAEGRKAPALVVLAYPTLLAAQPAPHAALRAALDADPAADHFGPDAVQRMYENYLGAPAADADIMAAPGLATAAELRAFPPTIMINSEVDELRVSGEAFAATLTAAGVDVDVSTEPGTTHGHLNRPEEPTAAASVERFAARIHSLRRTR
jgi:acetyl esterase/lipase